MFAKHPIADAALLLSDPARIAMLTSLLDGESRPAGELARIAGLSPQAATAHLAKLTAGQMLALRKAGRHRYYHIAKPEVGLAIEALAVTTPLRRPLPLPVDARQRALRFARTCYDHLAGQLAVQVRQGLESSGSLEIRNEVPELTSAGEARLQRIGIDIAQLRNKRRPFAKECLDWTERKHHLAGALGSALLTAFARQGWLVRQRNSRAVRLTSEGRRAIGGLIGMDLHGMDQHGVDLPGMELSGADLPGGGAMG